MCEKLELEFSNTNEIREQSELVETTEDFSRVQFRRRDSGDWKYWVKIIRSRFTDDN